MSKQQHLNDVYVIRPIAIFLLVVYHSFIIYGGGGDNLLIFSILKSTIG